MGIDAVIHFIKEYKYVYFQESVNIFCIKEYIVYFKYIDWVTDCLYIDDYEINQNSLMIMLHKLHVPSDVISEYCIENDISVVNEYFKMKFFLYELGE